MQLDRSTLASYLTVLSGSAGRLVVSLVYFVIVANTLSLADFGLFATASSTGIVLSRLAAFGFISPVFRVATVKRRLLGTYLGGFFALLVLSLPVIGLAAALVFTVFFAGKMGILAFGLIIVAEIIGWRLLELVVIVENGLRHFGRAATLVIVGSAIRTGVAVLFWLGGWTSIEAWAWSYLAANLIGATVAFSFFLPKVRWRFIPRLYGRRMHDALSASASDIVFYLQAELDKLLVLGLVGAQAAGIYAIAMRIIDLTALPVRSFNQLLVQSMMGVQGGVMTLKRRIVTEAGIAAVSIAGLSAIIILLMLWPLALGRNVAEVSPVFLLLLFVPAFRNLIEYHAELLYARERTVSRLLLLVLVGALKALLLWLLLTRLPEAMAFSPWLNLLFGALWLVSAITTYRLLPLSR
jgi:O-antigen/teichoic acid export membrane protein